MLVKSHILALFVTIQKWFGFAHLAILPIWQADAKSLDANQVTWDCKWRRTRFFFFAYSKFRLPVLFSDLTSWEPFYINCTDSSSSASLLSEIHMKSVIYLTPLSIETSFESNWNQQMKLKARTARSAWLMKLRSINVLFIYYTSKCLGSVMWPDTQFITLLCFTMIYRKTLLQYKVSFPHQVLLILRLHIFNISNIHEYSYISYRTEH